MSRKLKLNEKFIPLPRYKGDEIYLNGVFHFNISRILEFIQVGKVDAALERRPGMFEIIDGNYRMEKAWINEIQTIFSEFFPIPFKSTKFYL